MAMLPADAPAFYRQQGYYLYRQPVFSPDRFLQLTAIFEELLANKGDKRADQLDTPHFHEPRLLDFLLDDSILDLVEPLIGPDIGLWSSHFICKEPGIGRATPWHEDSAYWQGRFDHFGGIVTIWLAIDPSDRANGCMKVIPATHHNGFSQYVQVDGETNTFNREIPDIDESQAVYFELAPNQCSFHDSRLIHGADANKSPRRRCGYTMRYFSQHMKYNAGFGGNTGFKIWHARGRNPHHNPVVN
jgi:ectoine hydroxylase-related dioxygenase (phytanoyl-CoA dioxygenase family)